MANAIFYHKDGSTYKDVRGKRYHYPRSYHSRVLQTVGDWIIYYGPVPDSPSRYYTGMARVVSVEADPDLADHYYAFLDQYIDFDRPLDYRENGGYESQLVSPEGIVNPGRSVQAVRIIDQREFVAIVEAGLCEPDEWPDRTDSVATPFQIDEGEQSAYLVPSFDRPIMQQTINRPFRDAKFRQHVRRVYDRTCAFTGLRLINGGGRPEVEAAHIVPVERGGNDSIQNGIALSGTVHWMFDRGLLSMSDDFTILQSRHLNEDISHLLVRDLAARVPEPSHLRPHPHFLAWHRDNIFKR
ncbi:MAG: HNH endonuclease [Alphaproteobacteria bacterium]|nr:HNH endonuclease [Rhizobiaceae bacterium]MBU3959351.1 HNH endonuclease [Alphaproteobacteria bacterium]MBU4049508.1 HNH endonuclease [Alphaproteobacteria bacterium]MBU4089695.1 HNH endonuclease [Alphaproteobacteria bacterium]MBU4154815.1 HNH endonuclease [Alphaproteobacteria bacterium]